MGKGIYTYRMDPDGRSKPFAQGFLDFLDNKLFVVHQKGSYESESEDSSESENKDFNQAIEVKSWSGIIINRKKI